MSPARVVVALLFPACVVSASLLAQSPPPAATTVAEACAQIWHGREAEFERYLRTAVVASIKDVPVGVTRPSRALFEPGGLAGSMAWKPIAPGLRSGYFESYRSEIAAYELDKLLALGMVPPTVEREMARQTGAAVLWATPTRSFKDLGGVPGQPGVPGPPSHRAGAWTRQVVRAKMFDNLIANKDPNLGNWLVDEDWHLVLIDHSRSFTPMKTMVHRMDHLDRGLWDRFLRLDAAALAAAVGPWLGKAEVRAILERRDRMQQDVSRMLAARGNTVFLP